MRVWVRAQGRECRAQVTVITHIKGLECRFTSRDRRLGSDTLAVRAACSYCLIPRRDSNDHSYRQKFRKKNCDSIIFSFLRRKNRKVCALNISGTKSLSCLNIHSIS